MEFLFPHRSRNKSAVQKVINHAGKMWNSTLSESIIHEHKLIFQPSLQTNSEISLWFINKHRSKIWLRKKMSCARKRAIHFFPACVTCCFWATSLDRIGGEAVMAEMWSAHQDRISACVGTSSLWLSPILGCHGVELEGLRVPCWPLALSDLSWCLPVASGYTSVSVNVVRMPARDNNLIDWHTFMSGLTPATLKVFQPISFS